MRVATLCPGVRSPDRRGRGASLYTRSEEVRITKSEALRQALVAASPRLNPPPTPWASVVIHACIVGLWLTVFARGFVTDGLFGWAVGLVYVAYDTALLAFVFVKTLPLAGARPIALPRGRSATLGVIVAARNEAAILPATLRALFAQAEAPELVVVADDGSTDATGALLAAEFGLARPAPGCLSDPSPVRAALRWLALPHGGKPAALNAAIMLVETELVLTVDADTLLDDGAIAAMRRAFDGDASLVAATGVLAPVCGPSLKAHLFQWFQTYEYIRNFLSRYAWMQTDSLLLISGAFAAFRREAVLRVGGFDPACLVEDYELIHRLRRYGVQHGCGWTTAVVGASRAITEAPASLPAFLRQRRRWFGGFLQTQYWYRDMVGNPAYGALGTLMLPVKAADTWQPIYGLTAFGLLIVYLCEGRLDRINPVAGVIGLKLAVDVAFHLWSIHLYRRWVPGPRIGYGSGLIASLVEPFSFQLLRHLGAAFGWVVFLTGARDWGVQRRSGTVGSTTAGLR